MDQTQLKQKIQTSEKSLKEKVLLEVIEQAKSDVRSETQRKKAQKKDVQATL
jgi:hypothetical protein